MEKVLAFLVIVIGVVGLVFLIAALMAYPTMWLMNYLFAPSFLQMVFGITAVTFWKAFWFNLFMGLVVRSSSVSSNK